MKNGGQKNKSTGSDIFIQLLLFSVIVLVLSLFNLFERVGSPILLLPFFLLYLYPRKKS